MYSSRGGSGYGQSYAGQSAYGQNLGSGYSGSTVGGPDVGQHSVASRHSAILGTSQDIDVSGYRAHSSTTGQYGGQYTSVYGSAALSSAQQVPSLSAKGAGSSALEGRGGYAVSVSDSPKFASGDYLSSSSHGYGHKSDQLYGDKVLDYSGIDRRQYGERQSAYMSRDLQSDPTSRYAADPVGFSHQHQQSEIYDRIDQTTLLRQEQLLKAQSLQSASLDGNTRQTDYLGVRAAASRHPTQDLLSYGGRIDADPRGSSMLSAASYSGQHAPSILGAAPRRSVDDLIYSQSASNPGYGVSLPPGRDYASGKGLHGSGMESDYSGSMLSRSMHKDKDDRASYLREFELREEERRRERLREREREKERERLRERDREREHERERILERREKERERERKRAFDVRRERSPLRSSKDPRATSKGPSGTSKDPRGSSLTKEARLSRRDSPHHEISYRHRSPVKEKRREYVCKVYSSSLVETERDYLSLDKRYPRLFVSPEFTKVVVNWPRGDIKLSIRTPVSFDHDFVEEECAAEPKDLSSMNRLSASPTSVEQRNTVWNAKIILLSGLSRSALEDLSSDRSFDDRIPHICNILRFAILKKDHSFMAVGGPWESADGGDPSVDDSSLIRTALRNARDVIQLDLQNCQRWNRFLEIHYDRVGKDGLFSHKEITVLFVPDLSDCLPSLDAWRNQWLAHRKAVAEREQQLSFKREKSRDNKEAFKEKSDKKESVPSGPTEDVKKEKISKKVKKEESNNKPAQDDQAIIAEEGKSLEKKDQEETTTAKTTGSGVKSVKKKVIKKVVKQKVANKTNATASRKLDKVDETDNADKMTTDVPVEDSKSSESGDKNGDTTAKLVATGNASLVKGDADEVKDKKEINGSEDKPQDKSDSQVNAVNDPSVKTTKKKKIIKRVPKKKVVAGASKLEPSDSKAEGNVASDQVQTDTQTTAKQTDTQTIAKQTGDANNSVTQANKVEKTVPKMKSKPAAPGKQDKGGDSNKIESKSDLDDKKVEKGTGEKSGAGIDKQKASEKDNNNGKGKMKDGDKSKEVKATRERDGKDESKSKPTKEVRDKKSDEPPRHPGFILQTKGSKESKLRSLSLSLDSLLDYTDKDIEESTFEISLFAESIYEMLQYQMGCRILTFLQKLRIKFVIKRNQRKRQREDDHEKENVKNLSAKRPKGDDLSEKTEPSDVDKNTTAADDEKKAKNDDSDVKEEDTKMDDIEEEEDPEEDPEEYEEIENGSPQQDLSSEEHAEQMAGTNVEPDKADETSERDNEGKGVKESKSEAHSNEEREDKVDESKKEIHTVKEATVDKELLQAFHFFDRNRVGYIRVEDMRLMIHNLGKFLSHRDVKELVQSALLESNTGRDDRILYNKLVRMADI